MCSPCILNAVDVTDDKQWNGRKANENVRSGCKEDEGTDCEAVDRDSDL